ncbi:MAG TPA: ribonuclease HI family protein [Candidatus Nanoarchaeia archaeon]|nr:ribonuclease HI family protein [Candidatus Nanoarchaeia archaeon]
MHTDGGSRGNPGPAASGVVITTPDGQVVEAFGKYLGTATNNIAEYTAVKLALEAVCKYDVESVEFYMDSELVCRQLNGIYKIKNADLKVIFDEIKKLAQGQKITFSHVRREFNKLADAQVNIAIDDALKA